MTAGLSSLFFSFENVDKYAKETVFWNDLSFLRVYLGQPLQLFTAKPDALGSRPSDGFVVHMCHLPSK